LIIKQIIILEKQMKLRMTIFILLFITSLVLSACASRKSPPMLEGSADTPSMVENLQATKSVSAGSAVESVEGQAANGVRADTPAWISIALQDVTTGESFKITDFKGKVVLVENMAIWCTNCLKQQKQVIELHNLLGDERDLISVGMDIDPNEDSGMLKAYIDSKGFNWTYAIAPVEVSREMGQLYGAQYLNPTSVPMFIVDRQGIVHSLPFGVKSAADLQQALEPFLNAAS
jgi:thiol-disulfide isomerase/thioredoxin